MMNKKVHQHPMLGLEKQTVKDKKTLKVQLK